MLEILLVITAIIITVGYVIYALIRWPLRSAGQLLTVALLLVLTLDILDLLSVLIPQELFFLRNSALLVESLLPPLWLVFSLSFHRKDWWKAIGLFQRTVLFLSSLFLVAAILLPVHVIYYSPDFVEEKILFLSKYGFIFYLSMMAYLVLAMMNLERTMRSLAQHERWHVKFEIIGVGLLLAMLTVYFSQSLLYRSIDLNLLPARSVSLSISVLLILYSRIQRGEGRPIALSRDVTYGAFVLLIVGLYLALLGLLGEGMRYLNLPDQKTIFIVISLLGGAAILLITFSETLRRRIKLFIHKSFYQNKFDYQLQWLSFSERVSRTSTSEDLQSNIMVFYCETFGLQGAALYLRDTDTNTYLCETNFNMACEKVVFSSSNSLVRTLTRREWIISVADADADADADATLHEEVYPYLLSKAVCFVVPLLFNEKLEGFIFLGKQINELEEMTYEDYDLMKILARQTTSSILNLRLSRQLSTAQELAAIGKVSAFIIHDLKNQVSGLSLLLENARNYLDDPEFQQDMLGTLQNTVAEMNGLIHKLRDLKVSAPHSFEDLDLFELIKGTIENLPGNVALRGHSVMARVDAEGLRKVIINLTLNAIEASDSGAEVDILVGVDGQPYVKITDQGCGMSEDLIRTRLFRPFETTKKQGSGIGLYQCRQIMEAHRGRIDVDSELGVGSVFTVYFPA